MCGKLSPTLREEYSLRMLEKKLLGKCELWKRYRSRATKKITLVKYYQSVEWSKGRGCTLTD
jgi:hypothetical protein